ncbi:septum formation initiator family protein [Patescibacteria group bacterium]|nr:septum formation initiator family protein [Patescibacteria group bacterium]MBU1922233.1 septum formation initiator family protein [Patescibacteria group bacterium]
MKSRQSKLRKIFGLRLFLIINILVLFFVILGFGREYIRNYEIDKEIKELAQRAQGLETQHQDILNLVDKLKTDDFLEQEARLKLGLKKPGESVAIVPEQELIHELEAKSAGAAPAQEGEPSNPELWWIYFLGTNYDG